VSMSLRSGLQLQSGTWAWGKGESLNSKRSMEMVAEANGAVDAFLSFQVCRGDSKALEPSHRPVEVTSEACNSISVLLSLSGSRWLEYSENPRRSLAGVFP
jgi:hypothetical protein